MYAIEDNLESLCHRFIPATERLDCMLSVRRWVHDSAAGQSQSGDARDSRLLRTKALIIDLAEKICDWPLLIYLQQMPTRSTDHDGNSIQSCLQCASAHWQMGQFQLASWCLQRQLLAEPLNAQLEKCYLQLQQELEQLDFAAHDLSDGEIMLAPLVQSHFTSFRWQYDPDIAQLCNLPDFYDAEVWLDWLDYCQHSPNKHVLAVHHVEWGFIGCVGLEVFNGAGNFYYWLGADFQGQGFGPRAVNILLQLGWNYLGMHCCYARVYDYNLPSQKAMQKLGFQRLPFCVDAPGNNQLLFYCGPEKSTRALYQEAEQLLQDMGSEVRLGGSIGWKMGLSDEQPLPEQST
jgi:RimJ/RimL family protein N-acetyltransferase